MEFRRFYCYVIINCAVVLPLMVSKSISLNEIIAADKQQHRPETTEILTEITPERQPLIKDHRQRLETRVNTNNPQRKNLSSIKFRKAFHIQSPLKSKKIKFWNSQKPENKRKNQSIKREIDNNENLNYKHIPLLKSLGMLFDNLLSSNSIESTKINRQPRQNRQLSSDRRKDVVCKCAINPNTQAQQKTAALAKTVSIKTTTVTEDTQPETTTETSNLITTSHISNFRQHKKLPLLPARNTSSSRRDNNGLRSRGSPTFYGSFQRNNTRYYGDGQHFTKLREESDTEDDEEDTFSDPRNYASSDRSTEGILRGAGNDSRSNEETEEINVSEDENSAQFYRRNIGKSKRENQFKTGGDKTESGISISKYIRRLRGFLPENKVSDISVSQSKETHENTKFNDAEYNSNNKRIVDRNGTLATENQRLCAENEAIGTSNITARSMANAKKDKTSLLMIFDGYSVARDKNGENKMASKSIHIHA